MAHIAEDLTLLLLDNASGRPSLERERRERVLSAAVLLDLAHACRIRPALETDTVKAGRLLALQGPDLRDPVMDMALAVLRRRPMRAATAMAKLRRGIEPALLGELARAGQIQRVRVRRGVLNTGLRRSYAWRFADRTRVNGTRAAVLSALFDGASPTPTTAAVISLLHAVDGFDAILSLNDRGWRWVENRAGEIANGGWVQESAAMLPAVNLAVTTSVVRPALA
jgi:Golgi phosphoprotein 3 (GPP34)